MAWVLLGLQIGLSSMLLIAATGKVLRSEGFLAALRLSRLPAWSIRPLGVGVPAVEYGLAFALLVGTPFTLRIALGATVVLLAAFTTWATWILAQRLHVHCGCFGTGSTEIGPRSIARNGLLLLGAIGGLVLADQAPTPLPGPSVPLAITVTATSMGFVLLLALQAGLPGLVLTLMQIEVRRSQHQV